MGIGTTVKEYAKLARSFNMALTGMGPVFGALAVRVFDPFRLFILFIIGCGAHIFGFVLNDYIDIRIDKHSDELSERPLVSGTITPGKALAFALFGLAIMLGLGLYLVWPSFNPFMLLLLAAASATLYNFISKKAPGMDFLVAGAVGLLTLFGSATVSMKFSPLAIDIAILAFLQVMFMNIVAGGLKDIDHDYEAGGRTLAIACGCKVLKVRGPKRKKKGKNKARARKIKLKLVVTPAFKALAHFLELVFIILVMTPFVLKIGAFDEFELISIQSIVVVVLAVSMLMISRKLMAMPTFVRSKMRKLIGLHYTINFSLVPVMLSVLSPWIALFVIVPPAGFALSNLALHGKASAPKTM